MDHIKVMNIQKAKLYISIRVRCVYTYVQLFVTLLYKITPVALRPDSGSWNPPFRGFVITLIGPTILGRTLLDE
jgi:hypothetical protein